MFDVKSIRQLFVATNCARTANVQITDVNNATTYLGNGEVVIVNPQGVVLSDSTALKAVEYIRIVQRAAVGDSVYISAPIYGKNVTGFSCGVYTAATEKVVTVGYNGTSGTIANTLAVDLFYSVKLNPHRNDPMCSFKPKSFSYKADTITVPTQSEVANGIAKRIAYDTQGDSNFSVKVEVLTDSTPTGSTSGALTVTKGSTLVKAVTDIDNGGMVAGDYMLISGVAYKVESINTTANYAILEYPYQGASGTVADGSASFISAANATNAASKWGIRITAEAFTFDTAYPVYRKENFTVTSSTYLATPVVVTEATNGIGTYQDVYTAEWHAKTFFGNRSKLDKNVPTNYVGDTKTTETYDLVTINWINEETANIEGRTFQSGSIQLAIAVGADQGDGGTTTIKETLNKYIVTEWGFGSAISLT